MVYVGIDVAKDTHECLIVNGDGSIVSQPFAIANNHVGFEHLISKLESCHNDYPI